MFTGKRKTVLRVRRKSVDILEVITNFRGVTVTHSSTYERRVSNLSDVMKTFFQSRKQKFITLSIPENTSIVRMLTFPAAAKKKLRNMIAYELKDHISLDAEQVYFDYHLMSEKKGLLKVLLIAIHREPMEGILKTLQSAGITIEEIVHPATGLFNLFAHIAPLQKGYSLLIHPGRQSIQFLLCYQNRLIYLREMEISLTDRDEIIRSVQQMKAFIQKKIPSANDARVFFISGGTEDIYPGEWFQNLFKDTPVFWNENKKILYKTDEKNLPPGMIGNGLAMSRKAIRLNLIPRTFLKSILKMKERGINVLIAAGLAVFGVLLFLTGFTAVEQRKYALDQLTRKWVYEIHTLKPLIYKMTSINRRANDRIRELESIQSALGPDKHWSETLVVISSHLPRGVVLTEISSSPRSYAMPGKPRMNKYAGLLRKQDTASSRVVNMLYIRGVSENHKRSVETLRLLEKSGYFNDVSFRDSKESKNGDFEDTKGFIDRKKYPVDFIIACELR